MPSGPKLPFFAALALIATVSGSIAGCGELGPLQFPGGEGNKKWETLLTEAQQAQTAGKADAAEELYKKAIEGCVKKYGEEAPQTGTCVGYLAGFYMAKQDWRLAYNEYKRWKAIMQKVDPSGKQIKQIDEDLKKVKEKLIQYGLVPDEVLKKRAERKAKEDAEAAGEGEAEEEKAASTPAPKKQRKMRKKD